MGYAPPGSQDIYGAISGGIKEVNETIRTGVNALAGRGQRDKSLEERRAKAEQVLQEDKLVRKALEITRRATEQQRAQAPQPEAEPPAEPPLGRMSPVPRPSPTGSGAAEAAAPVPAEAPA